MKKIFNSGAPAIVGVTGGTKDLFPPGFRYRLGSIIYTVKADVTQEANSPMREVSLSDGATEIVPVEVLIKDIKSIRNARTKAGGEILEPDEKLMPKKAAVKKTKKKAKKKAKKKKKKTKEG